MSKDLFMKVRQSESNHYDTGRIKYWELQKADKEQIEHIKGNKKRWK